MSKRVDKAMKTLGASTVEEMDAMVPAALKQRIAEANDAMETVVEELEANEKYQALKEALNDMLAGKREVDKRQKAVIVYALHRLNFDGPGVSADESEDEDAS